tara:strand:+ start:28 stop:555 length:528 start_codon:yes stop_codon:yes gene_type:complete
MTKKIYNSKTAKNLAKRYKLTLYDIPISKKNKKVAIIDVKNAIQIRDNFKPFNLMYKGYFVSLLIQPQGVDEEIPLTPLNMLYFKKWWTKQLKLNYNLDIYDLQIVTHRDNLCLHIKLQIFNTNLLDDDILNITDPDYEGDYAISINQKGDIINKGEYITTITSHEIERYITEIF